MIQAHFDSPLLLGIYRLRTRLERLSTAELWFDPLAWSGQWAPDAWTLEPISATPRMGLPAPVVTQGVPWVVRPLDFERHPDRSLERLPVEIGGLYLRGLDDDMARFVSRKWGQSPLRRLVVERSGALTSEGFESIAALDGLTHLVLPHVRDEGALAALGPLRGLRFLGLPGLEVSGTAADALRAFGALTHLVVGGWAVGDDALAALRELPLEVLDLGVVRQPLGRGLRGFEHLRDLTVRCVDAAGFAAIATTPSLEHLDVHLTSEVDVSLLGHHERLQSISLSAPQGPVDGLAELASLRRLRLRGTLDSGSLNAIAALTELVELGLSECDLEDEDLAPLAALERLRTLDLKSNRITGAGLRYLRNAQALERLNLSNCVSLTSEGLAEVVRFPALQVLNLRSCVSPYASVDAEVDADASAEVDADASAEVDADVSAEVDAEVDAKEHTATDREGHGARDAGAKADRTVEHGGLRDDGLRILSEGQSLRQLDVSANRILPAAVSKLRGALPMCAIIASSMVRAPFGDLLREADEALDEGCLDDAEPILRKLMAGQAGLPQTHAAAARLFRARGDLPGALAALDRAIELDPDPRHFVTRAEIRSAMGNADDACVDLDRVLALDPDQDEPRFQRAEARFDSGAIGDAIADYTRVIERCVRGDADFRIWAVYAASLITNRGCARMMLGALDEAERDFDAAIALDPLDASAWTNRAETRLKLGRWSDAIADADRALELDPDSPTANELRAQASRHGG
ncbi:MAG: tetratricopeptide repeat protein [Deltaproteobacteria bacterium]|nr:tetratricopeptide repeat protein [Deltaproteobacteria bacterium]